ncbi:MAG: hypothetical protein GXO47_02790 [Chlorobi bacterium]|nr:hypothetical protein [Chlorobiota bacterium]
MRRYFFWVFISIIIGALSMLIFPRLQHFNIKYLKKIKTNRNWIVVYEDLNNDGRSEKLIFISDTLGFSSLLIYEGAVVHGQWRFKGRFPKGIFYSCGDYDKNGIEETCVFTVSNDTLYLNVIESYSDKTIIKNRKIRKLHLINGISNILIHPALFINLNSDKQDELLFAISTGYNFKDRVMCALFFENDSLIETIPSASCISYPYTVLKKDSNIIIAGMVREPGNTELTYSYSDQLAWFMAWDKNMDFLFEPVNIGEYPALIFVKPFVKDNKLFFAGLYNYYGVSDTSKIFIANGKGEIIKQKPLICLKGKSAFMPNDTKEELTIIDSDGNILIFDNNLNRKSTIQGEKVYYYDFFRKDITGDGVPDKIFNNDDFSSCVFFDPVSLAMIPVDIPLKGEPVYISRYLNDGKKHISFCLKGKILIYRFSESLLYRFRYMIPFVLIIILLTLVIVVKRFFNYYLNKKISRKNQIAKLQLLNLKRQLDSHFTFNMIDCIGNSFRKNDFETADKLFIRYARLLQQSVQLSGEIAVPLETELEYIENYLTLEKIRSENRFDFEIDNNVKSLIEVPKFMLFTFVENAVKHGVLPLSGRMGFILVKSVQKNKTVDILIIDNGKGINNKNINKNGTGNGLKIVKKLISFFKSEYNLIINYSIDDANPGTKIHITLKNGK